MFDPARYSAAFEREQGFSTADWCRMLPGAVAPHRLHWGPAEGQAEVCLGESRLHLAWSELPPRRIALLAMPRLAVRYRFEQVADAERVRFMRHFDLFTQRGGG